MSCIRDWTISQYGSRGTDVFVLRAIQCPLLYSPYTPMPCSQTTLDSRGICVETRFHCAFNSTVDVSRSWKEPLLIIIAFITVLIDGKGPILHLPRVFQTTNGMLTSIILPIQIEELPLVAWDVDALGVPDGGPIEVLDDGFNLRLDRLGYPSCRVAFRAGGALSGRPWFGLGTLRLLWALYLHQLPPM